MKKQRLPFLILGKLILFFSLLGCHGSSFEKSGSEKYNKSRSYLEGSEQLPEGVFWVGMSGRYSNGKGYFCHYESWNHFERCAGSEEYAQLAHEKALRVDEAQMIHLISTGKMKDQGGCSCGKSEPGRSRDPKEITSQNNANFECDGKIYADLNDFVADLEAKGFGSSAINLDDQRIRTGVAPVSECKKLHDNVGPIPDFLTKDLDNNTTISNVTGDSLNTQSNLAQQVKTDSFRCNNYASWKCYNKNNALPLGGDLYFPVFYAGGDKAFSNSYTLRPSYGYDASSLLQSSQVCTRDRYVGIASNPRDCGYDMGVAFGTIHCTFDVEVYKKTCQ